MIKLFLSLVLVGISVGGCAPSNLKTPCPDFGLMCHKTPVNGWSQ